MEKYRSPIFQKKTNRSLDISCMKYTLYIAAIFIIMSFGLSSNKNKVINSKWLDKSVVIDGNIDEWAQKPLFFDKETKLLVSIANDSSNFYLTMVIHDELVQTKILRSGLIVSLDTLGKKKEHISIQYPMKSDLKGKQSIEKRGKPNLEEIKKMFKLKPQFMLLSGFKSGNGTGLLQNVNGIAVKLDWDENNSLIYELKVPFSSIGNKSLNKDNINNKFSLIVKLPAVTKIKVDGTSGATKPTGGRPTGPPSGGGRPSGGRPKGAGGPPNMEGMSLMFEEQYLLQKFIFTLN